MILVFNAIHHLNLPIDNKVVIFVYYYNKISKSNSKTDIIYFNPEFLPILNIHNNTKLLILCCTLQWLTNNLIDFFYLFLYAFIHSFIVQFNVIVRNPGCIAASQKYSRHERWVVTTAHGCSLRQIMIWVPNILSSTVFYI